MEKGFFRNLPEVGSTVILLSCKLIHLHDNKTFYCFVLACCWFLFCFLNMYFNHHRHGNKPNLIITCFKLLEKPNVLS